MKMIKGKGPIVATLNGGILLEKVKPENKKILNGFDLINGGILKLGDKFDLV